MAVPVFAACITVGDILGLMSAGQSRETILQDYPYLEDADIDAVLAFAARQADHPIIAAESALLFLVDAQLPPSLAEALHDAGCQAVHLIDLGMLAANDEANSRSAALVTKDRDFPLRRAASNDGPAILWVRVGNTSN